MATAYHLERLVVPTDELGFLNEQVTVENFLNHTQRVYPEFTLVSFSTVMFEQGLRYTFIFSKGADRNGR